MLDDLLPALARLDQLLQQASLSAPAAYGPEAATDPYRGLYISRNEIERLLAREPGVSPLRSRVAAEQAAPDAAESCEISRLVWLQEAFALSPFDLDVILIALAPEIDLRYERLYAYLQDDVTRRRPSVDLVLNLLSSSAETKLLQRGHFVTEAPLVKHGIIHLIADANQLQIPLLAHYLKLDDQIVNFLLGLNRLDARLSALCERVDPTRPIDQLPLPADTQRALSSFMRQARTAGQPLRLCFHGPRGAGKQHAAAACAQSVGSPLLVMDLSRWQTSELDFDQMLRLALRQAWFNEAVLYVDELDVLRGEDRLSMQKSLLRALECDAGITILAGTQPWRSATSASFDVINVPFSVPDFAQRRSWWTTCLADIGQSIEAAAMDALADRFRLTPAQIHHAVTTASQQAVWRAALADNPPRDPQATVNDFFVAARMQSGHELAVLTVKIDPVHTWDDLILPDDSLAQLREVCQRVAYQQRVWTEWGFGYKASHGRGSNALFAGPSGTGKTTAAEIIANELGLDLYKIDLSQVVSKYIGETEKNLDRIFTAAENANAILFFDEADALFGKRSEVRDSHDRYANIEISYLLQKMEQYAGLAILATNLRQNMDDAFTRRLHFVIEFPFPDEAQRLQIWRLHFPREAPREASIDFNLLARQFRLSGGNIKNIVVGAAFLAAADGGQIGMAHLLQATRREYQKMGKVLSEVDFNTSNTEVLLKQGER